MIEVLPVADVVTFPLRHAVLRPNVPVLSLALPSDLARDAQAFAAYDGDKQVVGTGIVFRNAPGWQLRGMAVDPGCRGQGIGTAVLDAIIDHVRDHGGGTLWCNARIPARGLYERRGFTPVGAVFDLEDVGPHIKMTLHVPA